jgi:hypothetical protein
MSSSNRNFIRPIETRDRGIHLYCTATPETYGADNAPLQCHDEDTLSSRQSGPSPGRVK